MMNAISAPSPRDTVSLTHETSGSEIEVVNTKAALASAAANGFHPAPAPTWEEAQKAAGTWHWTESIFNR